MQMTNSMWKGAPHHMWSNPRLLVKKKKKKGVLVCSIFNNRLRWLLDFLVTTVTIFYLMF